MDKWLKTQEQDQAAKKSIQDLFDIPGVVKNMFFLCVHFVAPLRIF